MVRWLRWHCLVTEAPHNTRGWGRNIFVSFKPPRPGTEPRTLAWKAAVLTTTLGPPPPLIISKTYQRDDVRERDRQRDHFQNCYIFVARRVRRRAGCHASHVALHVVIGRRVGVWTNTRFSCVLCFMWMWSERAASEILNYIHMENQIKFILIILLEDMRYKI